MNGFDILQLFNFKQSSLKDLENLIGQTEQMFVVSSKLTGEKLKGLRAHPMNAQNALIFHKRQIHEFHTFYRNEYKVDIDESEPLVYEVTNPKIWIPFSQLHFEKINKEEANEEE
ncbi:unnamed protein product [Caenorhabditis angaria]|uniref:Uncharacterized protein n=1 Tax=Caenorhabditis angaria TaxID=860376 RepID=A0A9P1J3G2_9PELO|nr:unnamed protein product [Caenorhabditis angaria]